jgi:hypothetical protein
MNLSHNPVNDRSLPADHRTILVVRTLDTAVLMAILVAITVLAIRHDIRAADATTLIGTLLGFAGRGLIPQVRSRRSDDGPAA